MNAVTPPEIAKTLDVTGLTFRNWLRSEQAAGHPILDGHEHGARYYFTREQADQLAAEYRASNGRARAPGQPYAGAKTAPPPQEEAGATPRRAVGPTAPSTSRPARAAASAGSALEGHTLSADPGHRVSTEWMGEQIVTLADLLRPGLQSVVVGINPSPVSVAVGHYYQGQIGQRFFKRLDSAGVIDLSVAGLEDDVAFAAGIGFTDVVKRPTARADALRPGELEHGRELLEAKLAHLQVPRVVFTFKGGAEALLGKLSGHGLMPDVTLAGAEVFVMPGPMERTDRVERALADLRAWWNT